MQNKEKEGEGGWELRNIWLLEEMQQVCLYIDRPVWSYP